MQTLFSQLARHRRIAAVLAIVLLLLLVGLPLIGAFGGHWHEEEAAYRAHGVVCQVIVAYIDKTGKAPQSWQELVNGVELTTDEFTWPEAAERVRRHVDIDFGKFDDSLTHDNLEVLVKSMRLNPARQFIPPPSDEIMTRAQPGLQ